MFLNRRITIFHFHQNMHFSNQFSPLSLISFSLLVCTAAVCADPLNHMCFSPDNYTASSPYASNLRSIINLLRTQAPPTGFGVSSVGQGPDRVNGLALCRGDVSATNCKACLADASREIGERCPSQKGAIIWYDNCLFKYSSAEFFGEIDNINKFYYYSQEDVNVNETKQFNQKTKILLSQLATKAYASPLLYAAGEAGLHDSTKLYGLVQCTRDLSAADCYNCLDSAISELPICCDGKRGGRVVGGSCNFRYELYDFINS